MAKYPDGTTATKICEVCDKDKDDASRMMNILEKIVLLINKELIIALFLN